jgi:hypothetical protein
MDMGPVCSISKVVPVIPLNQKLSKWTHARLFEFAICDRNKLQPPAAAMSASVELRFLVADRAELDALHEQGVQKGIEIIMPPAKTYFGGVHFIDFHLKVVQEIPGAARYSLDSSHSVQVDG